MSFSRISYTLIHAYETTSLRWPCFLSSFDFPLTTMETQIDALHSSGDKIAAFDHRDHKNSG